MGFKKTAGGVVGSRGNAWPVWTLLVVSLVYPAYRYPLQINFSGTSPTYSDTPPLLQVGKYALLGLLALVCIITARKIHLKRSAVLLPVSMLLLAMYPVGVFLVDRDSRHVIFPFLVGVSALCVGGTREITLTQLRRLLRVLLAFSLVVNLIQVTLFLTIGRLPALAYENSISVRFGSFLDDPNGFGNLLMLLLGFAYVQARNCTGWLLVAGVIVSLLLTQSLTALALLLPLGTLVWARAVRRYWGWALVVPLFTGAVWWAYQSHFDEFLNDFLELKSGSIDGHLSWLTVGNVNGIFSWLIGSGAYSPSESWWLGSLYNYGIVWSAALLMTCLIFLFKVVCLYREAGSRENRAVLMAVVLFSAHFVLASVNLPFFTVFPNNVLFLTLFFIVSSGKLKICATEGVKGRLRPCLQETRR